MIKITLSKDYNTPASGGTAAARYHLSPTLDWSSQSAQVKNRVVVVPVVTLTPPDRNNETRGRSDRRETR